MVDFKDDEAQVFGDSVLLEEGLAENALFFFCSSCQNSMSTLFTFSQRQKCDDQSVLCSALRKNLHCKVTVTVAECVISVAAAGEKEDRGGKNEGDDLLCFCHILSLIKRKNKL